MANDLFVGLGQRAEKFYYTVCFFYSSFEPEQGKKVTVWGREFTSIVSDLLRFGLHILHRKLLAHINVHQDISILFVTL